MNKKDYILIANSIVSALKNYENKEEIDTKLVAAIVTSISNSLYSQNTSFNRDIFLNHILNGVRDV